MKTAWLLTSIAAAAAFAQQAPRLVPEDHRPSLFLREDWKFPSPKQVDGGFPLTQAAVSNPAFELKLYGVGRPNHDGATECGATDCVLISWRTTPKDDPTFVYMGPCLSPCGVALRNRDNYVDLTGLAKFRWRTKQTGFHMLRPMLKLADGTWLVGDHAESATTDWRVTEFALADVRWHLLNIEYVVTTKTDQWVAKPDLSRVDEFGFVDLMPGNVADHGHGTSGTSRVDWIEIYGNPAPRR